MALILSPWPDLNSPEEVEAIAYIKRAVGGLAREESSPISGDEAARSLGTMAAERIEREAPAAPQATKNEAARMFAGYFAQANYGSVRGFTTVGASNVDFVVNHRRAWINCGAKMILSPWKSLNVGRIDATADGT